MPPVWVAFIFGGRCKIENQVYGVKKCDITENNEETGICMQHYERQGWEYPQKRENLKSA